MTNRTETEPLPRTRERVEPLWRFGVASGSVTGNGHTTCEDHRELGRASDLVVVCDGIGGAPRGHLAAETACKAVVEGYEDGLALGCAVKGAGARVATLGGWLWEDGMGCTVAAAALEGGRMHVAWLGDTLAFRLRSGSLESLYEPDRAFGTNQITGFLGGGGSATPHELLDDVEEGDAYLLCTDGLWGELGEACIRDVLLGANGDATGAVRGLLGALGHDGPRDDATVVVLACKGRMAESDEEEQEDA